MTRYDNPSSLRGQGIRSAQANDKTTHHRPSPPIHNNLLVKQTLHTTNFSNPVLTLTFIGGLVSRLNL